MAIPQRQSVKDGNPALERRGGHTLAAFVLGLPLAAGILWLFHNTALHDTAAARYVTHPVQWVEVVMFCCALGVLLSKTWGSLGQRRAFGANTLPAWDGRVVAVGEASGLLATVRRMPRRWQGTWLVRRTRAVLDFLCSRGSADELDDQLRALADADAIALENSGSLLRFITWAIPILGFLGTVLGITQAISGVTPEVLEHDLSRVTDGLAEAFDSTALALGLTMLTMFLTFLVDRLELGVLEAVDAYADRELAHRFARSARGGTVPEALRQDSEALRAIAEQLVQRQAEVWGQALEAIDRKRTEAEKPSHERLAAEVATALERTLEAHARRLAAMEQQATDRSSGLLQQLAGLAAVVRDMSEKHEEGLRKLTESLAAQAETTRDLQTGEVQLRRVQELLNQNLTAVTAAGTFEQALHSLTAAIHLLTARAGHSTGSTSNPRVAA